MYSKESVKLQFIRLKTVANMVVILFWKMALLLFLSKNIELSSMQESSFALNIQIITNLKLDTSIFRQDQVAEQNVMMGKHKTV